MSPRETSQAHAQSTTTDAPPEGRSREALEAQVDYWRSRYEQERERLAKLWALYEEASAGAPAPEPPPTVLDVHVVREEPAGPYRHGAYTLYSRDVQLKNGARRPIYFFAKRKPKRGHPVPLPEGYEVLVNERTGLPFLRHAGGAAKIQKAVQPQCGALTASGDQCRNSARQGSGYCASHAGYRPPTAKALLAAADTRPRDADSPDTPPAVRGQKWEGSPATVAGHHPQCAAIGKDGKQCRNSARDSSKYCASHKGYQPKTLEALVVSHDTKPRARRARDVPPRIRKAA